MTGESKIRVLVVDDSAIVRKILSEALAAEPDIEVVGVAPDPFVARDKILALNPDVLTLDIEMPRMDGLTFLRKLMHYRPMPVIVISSVGGAGCPTAIEALRLGAVEVLGKPSGPFSVGELRDDLAWRIRAAARARVSNGVTPKPAEERAEAVPSNGGYHSKAVIAIGASTGGTEAVESVLRNLPADIPGVLVVQHIPAGFSRAFASRLNQVCSFEVQEAAHGDYLVPGRVLMAPGDCHMLLSRAGVAYRVQVTGGPRVCYQRPSVDVLFASVAEKAGKAAVGVILTGMGADGAQGMKKMKEAGAFTIAQDEATSVVFGMPREAIRIGAVDAVLPLSSVAGAIVQAASRSAGKRN